MWTVAINCIIYPNCSNSGDCDRWDVNRICWSDTVLCSWWAHYYTYVPHYVRRGDMKLKPEEIIWYYIVKERLPELYRLEKAFVKDINALSTLGSLGMKCWHWWVHRLASWITILAHTWYSLARLKYLFYFIYKYNLVKQFQLILTIYH